LSGHRKKLTRQGPLTFWRSQREGVVRIQKESNRARDTHFLEIAEKGLVRTQKETNQLRVRGTYKLETTEGGTCQDIQRNQLSKGHLLSGDSRGGYLSGHRWKLTDQGALTNWRWQEEGLVRTQKETD